MTSSTRSRTAVVCRISNIFSGGANPKLPSLPKDVKEAVSKCRQATQEALQKQQSRMDIEFPVGTKFNVERVPKRNKMKDESNNAPTQSDLQRSDRELARLFVDMFQPVGGDRIAVVFNDVLAADTAKQKWKGDSTAQSRILSLDRSKAAQKYKKKRQQTSTKKKGFAAKLAQELNENETDGDSLTTMNNPAGPFQLPPNTEVALFVAPGPKELIVIERICQEVGMGTLVVLLNARTSLIQMWNSKESEDFFKNEFETVFHLAAAPQDVAPSCLLHRAFPGEWVLARKPRVGAPQTILTTQERPTSQECQIAYENLKISDVEKNVEGALEGFANWLS